MHWHVAFETMLLDHLQNFARVESETTLKMREKSNIFSFHFFYTWSELMSASHVPGTQ